MNSLTMMWCASGKGRCNECSEPDVVRQPTQGW
jgi:hypothetical protein